MAGIFDRIGGGVQNAVARGSVYNSTTGQYAPGNVRWQRMVQGGLSRLGGPQGALASLIWGKISDRNPQAQRFDRGLQVAPHILPNGWREGHMPQAGMNIGPYQGGVTYPTMSMGAPMGAGMGGALGALVGNRMDAGAARQLDATLARNEDRIGAELSANLAGNNPSRDGQPNGSVMWRPGEMLMAQNGNRAFMNQLSRQAQMGQSPYNRRV